MFEFKMTGFLTINNKQLIDGHTKNSSFSGFISNGITKIKIQPTISHAIIKDSPIVFEVMEGLVSQKDIGTIFKNSD